MRIKTLIISLVYLMTGVPQINEQSPISIMSFNVRYDEALFNKGEPKETDWANRKVFQVGLINFHTPDVIGMQEPHLHQGQYFEENLPDYSWVGVGREDGKREGEYNPIFYNNSKLKLVTSGTFWLSATPDQMDFGSALPLKTELTIFLSMTRLK